MAGDCIGILSFLNARKQEKQERKRQMEKQHEQQRQKNPNGLLELALSRPFSTNSFTAADPGRFYQGHGHAGGEDPWKK